MIIIWMVLQAGARNVVEIIVRFLILLIHGVGTNIPLDIQNLSPIKRARVHVMDLFRAVVCRFHDPNTNYVVNQLAAQDKEYKS